MKRFVLLCFGFLGWAFYEMSGGSDFESASDRVARLNPAPAVTVLAVDETAEDAPVSTAATVVDIDPPNSETEVTRVSLNLTTLEDSTQGSTENAAQPTTANTAANVDPETGVAVNTGLSLASADTPAIIPSLIAPNDTGAATVQTASLQSNTSGTDIRTVSGNRVNVRGGPGTDFNVVGKLVRGDSVEIIEDNGNGWVLMRSVDTGAQGWLADFLLNG
jgi:hypothetical protein